MDKDLAIRNINLYVENKHTNPQSTCLFPIHEENHHTYQSIEYILDNIYIYLLEFKERMEKKGVKHIVFGMSWNEILDDKYGNQFKKSISSLESFNQIDLFKSNKTLFEYYYEQKKEALIGQISENFLFYCKVKEDFLCLMNENCDKKYKKFICRCCSKTYDSKKNNLNNRNLNDLYKDFEDFMKSFEFLLNNKINLNGVKFEKIIFFAISIVNQKYRQFNCTKYPLI